MENKHIFKTIKELKSAAKTIYDNADKMIGGYQAQADSVDIMIRISATEAPTITVDQTLYPDRLEDIYTDKI